MPNDEFWKIIGNSSAKVKANLGLAGFGWFADQKF